MIYLHQSFSLSLPERAQAVFLGIMSASDQSVSGHKRETPHKAGVPTLLQLAEQRALAQLKQAVEGYQSTANYCCGGRIAISSPIDSHETDLGDARSLEYPTNAPPIAIRWDAPKEELLSNKITFPFVSGDSNSTATSIFDSLLQACAPATFGHNGKDVLDEGYRKAGKLDRTQFSVDFHPHDFGVLDAISQLLLPEVRGSHLEGREEHRGVLAELYKLNVNLTFSFLLLITDGVLTWCVLDILRSRGQVQSPH